MIGRLVTLWTRRAALRRDQERRNEPMTPPDDDAALLAAVRGLGDETQPAPDVHAAAALLPEWEDLRGARDRDENTPHPWRNP